MTTLLDGKALAATMRADLAGKVADFSSAHGRPPALAVVLVGDDPASAVYVRNKVRACEAHGLHSVLETHSADLSEATLLQRC